MPQADGGRARLRYGWTRIGDELVRVTRIYHQRALHPATGALLSEVRGVRARDAERVVWVATDAQLRAQGLLLDDAEVRDG